MIVEVMTMNLLKGLIKCKSCGKNFNFKNDNGTPIYLCSGYKNYGSKYCPRNIIHEKDIKSVVELHLSRTSLGKEIIKENVNIIEVNGDLITIFYKDGSKSEWNNSRLSI
jgi:hypothetical protein